MHPKPDRSDQILNFEKSEENDAIDLGWSEGYLSDGRPYRAECWAQNQITMVTFFFSMIDMENYSDEMFVEWLEKEEVIRFVIDNPHITTMPVTDAVGNNMWSVNVVIGTEYELQAKDSVSFNSYKKAGM